MTEIEHLEFEIALLKDLVAAKDRIILEMEENCWAAAEPEITNDYPVYIPPIVWPAVYIPSMWDNKPFPPVVTCTTTSSSTDGKFMGYNVDYDNFGDTLARSAGS